MLFIGTQFSNLYTSVYPPTKGRVVVCLVFVIACKYARRLSQVSQPLNPLVNNASSDTLAFSLRLVPSQPDADAPLTRAGFSAAPPLAPPPFHGPISFTFPLHLVCVC